MVQLEADGTLVFEIEVAGARSVELVGAFHGWHLERIPMQDLGPVGETTRSMTGSGSPSPTLPPNAPDAPPHRFRAVLDLRAGAYLFHYLVDDERRELDPESHGTRLGPDGQPWSRAWCPSFSWAAEAHGDWDPRTDRPDVDREAA